MPRTAEPTWYDALVATPFDTGDASQLWAVVKGKSGAAEWVAQSEPVAHPARDALHERRRTLAALSGARGQAPAPLMRVLREPIARENAPLLTLALATGPTASVVRSADPSDDAPAAIEFELSAEEVVTATPGGGAVVIAVTATAAATGTLVVRSATAYFKT